MHRSNGRLQRCNAPLQDESQGIRVGVARHSASHGMLSAPSAPRHEGGKAAQWPMASRSRSVQLRFLCRSEDAGGSKQVAEWADSDDKSNQTNNYQPTWNQVLSLKAPRGDCSVLIRLIGRIPQRVALEEAASEKRRHVQGHSLPTAAPACTLPYHHTLASSTLCRPQRCLSCCLVGGEWRF